MDIYLSEDEELLQRSIRELLEKECPISLVEESETSRTAPAQLWAALQRSGWLSVGVEESAGGNGGTVLDWVLAVEEMGKVACPGPVVEQGAASIALAHAGLASSKAVVSGEALATVALRDGKTPTTISAAAVNGAKKLVPYADTADLIIPVSGNDAAVIARTAPGVDVKPVTTLAAVPSADVTFSGAVPSGVLSAGELTDLFLLGRDAYALGLMGRILSMTVEYAKDRVQFGRPIGSFQAVQHHCADLALIVYGTQNLVYHAAWLLANGRPAGPELSMAHGYSRFAAAQATIHGHQVHGAMGFTAEYPLQYFSRRAKTHSFTYGNAAEHREKLASVLPELVKDVS